MRSKIYFVLAPVIFFVGGLNIGRMTAQHLDYARALDSSEVRNAAMVASYQASRDVYNHKLDSILNSAHTDSLILEYVKGLPLCNTIPLDTNSPSIFLNKVAK